MNTIEKKLQNIFTSLFKFYEILGDQEKCEYVMELQETCILATSNVNYEYYKNNLSESAIKAKLIDILNREHFLESVANLLKESTDILQQYRQQKQMFSRLSELIDKCNMNSINVYSQNESYNQCQLCSSKMIIDLEHAEMTCTTCGFASYLVGTIIYENSMFYNNDAFKNKVSLFNPNKHYNDWINHISSKDPDNVLGLDDGESLLIDLRKIIVRDKKILKLLTIKDIRKMLKEVGKTSLNKHSSLILKKLTGISPPHLPTEILAKAESIFIKAIEVSEKHKREDRTNRNYYPYYIYKTLDILLDEKDYENRRFLDYIHFQSYSAITKCDQDWQVICKELDLPFRVTIKR